MQPYSPVKSPGGGYQSKASQEAVVDTARIMDKGWEQVQKKTFTNWINTKLQSKELPAIADLDHDLSSGEALIQLLEIIGDEELGRYNKKPKMRLQKFENVNKALEFIKKRGVNLTNIGAEDIVDGNAKLLLGLIWTIILRFSIAEISQDGVTAKEGLLLWCQRKTAPYVPTVNVRDFTGSWQDGLAFCALIHRHRPDLLDFHALDKSAKHENMAMAFEIAASQLGIPKLMDVEDLVDVIKPDERSVMTYVAQYFHAFSALDKVEQAGRRIGKLGVVLHQNWEMQNDYESRVAELKSAIAEVQGRWAASKFDGYTDARRQQGEFEKYKNTTKRAWVSEKRELEALLGNIQTKLKTYNMTPFTPSEGLTLSDVDKAWHKLVETEAARKKALATYIRDIKEVLRKKFADGANKFIADLNGVSSALVKVDGELEQQLNAVKSLITKLEPLKSTLKGVEKLNADCVEANIEDNEYTVYSIDDLSFELGLLAQSLEKKATFIENQIVARNVVGVTPEQLESYSEAFRHFDGDNSNSLNRPEFQAAMQANGIAYSDEELEQVFMSISADKVEITFEEYINFAKSLEEDQTSPEQLNAAFRVVCGDKGYVTQQDLQVAGLDPGLVDYLVAVMPPVDGAPGAFDYASYIGAVFSS